MRDLHTSLIGALLVAFLSAAMAQNDFPPPLTGFTGNWGNTGMMYLPSWDSNGVCTVGSSLYRYAYKNFTFPSDGVARLSSFTSFDAVYVYWGAFNPANPCSGNGNRLYNDEDNVVYNYDNYYYYPGGQPATFVFASSGDYGNFAGIITEGWTNATSNSSGQTWVPIYVSSSGVCVTESDSDQPYYQSLPVVVSSTGYYDISAYFPRNAANDYPSYTYLALFKGAPNSSFTTDACGPVGDNAELVDAYYGNEQYGELVWQYLVAGVQYTLIVSANDNTFWGPFGWNVQNSTTFNMTYPVSTTSGVVGGFNEPMRDSDMLGPACMVNSGSYNNVPYAVITFSIPAYENFTLYFTQPHDYEFFYYSGYNPIPVACPATGSYVFFSDSGGPFIFTGTSATQFTVVVTPYYTGTTTPGYQTQAYLVYGPPITSGGTVVTTTTTTTTTGSTTTTTTGSTTTTTTTGSTTTTTSKGTTGLVSTTGVVTTGTVATTGVVATTGTVPTTGVVSTTAKVTTSTSTTTKVTTGTTSSKSTTSGNNTSGSSVSARVGGAVLFVAAVFALLL